MKANVSELPAVLRSMVKGALKCRKILVLCVGDAGHAVTDGAIVAVSNGAPVQSVGYYEGGGYRAAAPVIVVDGFGGCPYVAITKPEGFPHTFNDMGTVRAALDYWAERGAFQAVAA